MSAALRTFCRQRGRSFAALLMLLLSQQHLNAQKAPFVGLVAMGKIPGSVMSVPGSAFMNDLAEPKAHPDIYVGVDLNFTWAQIQPSNSEQLNTQVIDKALQQIVSYNKAHKRSMRAKLHVWAGVNAPAWVLAMNGGPVSLKTPAGTLAPHPRFWAPSYHEAWRHLQTRLAEKYDSDPLVAEVGASSCASRTDEPMIVAHDPASISSLRAAGYKDADYVACLTHGVTDDYSGWASTPIDFPFNSFVQADTGQPVINSDVTLKLMQTFRASFGAARGVIATHGLQDPLNGIIVPVYNGTAMYKGIKQLGPPIEFQTINQRPAGGWDQSVSVGFHTYHASEIEVWVTTAGGGAANISREQLISWAAQATTP